MELKVRKGEKADLPIIFELVKALALYENEPDAVTATLNDYYSNFEENVFQTLVAEQDDKIIGMMLYYITYSTWKGKMIYLEDFIVTKKYRQKGVGQHLMNYLIEVSTAEKAKLIRWQVLDWNTPAINFYEKNFAIFEKNWWNCKVFI